MNPAIAKIALGVVAPERSGMASGISNTFRTGGLAIGVAALGALFERKVANSLAVAYHHPVPDVARIVSSSGVAAAVKSPHGLADVARHAHVAFVSGMHLIIVIALCAAALGSIAGFTLVRHRDFQSVPVPAPSPTAAT